jgi:nucleotide-binding universal stress UspA family protein
MKTRLIVLIDFSADNLFQFAGLWSEVLKADLLLVHQVPGLIPSLADGQSRALIIEQEKKDAMSRLKALAGEHFPHLTAVKYHVSEQPLQLTIESVTFQTSNYYNLILVGLKKRGVIQQLIFGSTTSRLIDEINHPFIAVPANVEAFLPDKLITAVSYHYPLNVKAFEAFVHAIEETVQVSEVISVVTPNDNEKQSQTYLQKLTEELRKKTPTSYKLFVGEEPFKEIKSYALYGQQNSLLVVQKGSRTLSDQFFRRFLINELVHDGSMPLVVIPV